MKRVNGFVLAALLSVAPAAFATNSSDSCPGNSCHNDSSASVGNVTANGGAASSNAAVTLSGNSSVRNDISNAASSDQHQGQSQSTLLEAPAADVEGMGRELAKHADSAARSQALSGGNVTPCGDSSGLGGQGGLFGFSVGTVSETCKAFRLQQLEALDAERKNVPLSTRLAEATYYVGFLPRLVLHVASFGILN